MLFILVLIKINNLASGSSSPTRSGLCYVTSVITKLAFLYTTIKKLNHVIIVPRNQYFAGTVKTKKHNCYNVTCKWNE